MTATHTAGAETLGERNGQVLNCAEGGAGTCRNAAMIEQLRAELQAAQQSRKRKVGNELLPGPERYSRLKAQVATLKAELQAAQAQVAALRAALQMVEWEQDDYDEWCPWCRNVRVDSHAPDCPRQVALGLAGKVEEETR